MKCTVISRRWQETQRCMKKYAPENVTDGTEENELHNSQQEGPDKEKTHGRDCSRKYN